MQVSLRGVLSTGEHGHLSAKPVFRSLAEKIGTLNSAALASQ